MPSEFGFELLFIFEQVCKQARPSLHQACLFWLLAHGHTDRGRMMPCLGLDADTTRVDSAIASMHCCSRCQLAECGGHGPVLPLSRSLPRLAREVEGPGRSGLGGIQAFNSGQQRR